MSPPSPSSGSPARSLASASTADDRVDRRRVVAFLAVAFGLAWLVALVIAVTGGLRSSAPLVGGLTVAAVLLPTGYMFAPAVAAVAVRLATGEGISRRWLALRLDGNLRSYAVAWLLPALATAAGAATYFALFPGRFDPTLSAFGDALVGLGVDADPTTLLALQVGLALTLAPPINAVFAAGEEFGWRGFLLPALLPLGARRATLAVGVVWGVWHWPIVAMGYNYGFSYPGAPWTGMLAMVWFTLVVGVLLAWLTLRTGSVWPAALGHGAVNAVAGLAAPFVTGPATPLLGPLPVGLVGSVGFTAVAAWLLARSPAFASG